MPVGTATTRNNGQTGRERDALNVAAATVVMVVMMVDRVVPFV